MALTVTVVISMIENNFKWVKMIAESNCVVAVTKLPHIVD